MASVTKYYCDICNTTVDSGADRKAPGLVLTTERGWGGSVSTAYLCEVCHMGLATYISMRKAKASATS